MSWAGNLGLQIPPTCFIKKWDKEVEDNARKLEEVEEWARRLEEWGNKNRDWFIARASARIVGQLHQAIAETYDLQYLGDDDEIRYWRKAHID